MVDSPEMDPDRLARHEFTTTFRGFDQAEVRAVLAQVGSELGAARERVRELRAELEQKASEPPDLERIDERRLTELLGEETARIFEAAREVAAEIRAKAEAKTAQLVRDAQAEANRMTGDAADVLRLRTTEAETRAAEIIADAQAEADRLVADATAEAESTRVEAVAAAEAIRGEAEAIREQATLDAEAEVEEARRLGREMVSEAQVVRERILKDLARRRRVGKAQLEQLRAARERLLDAYALVRRTVEEATTELTVVVPEAKLAADAAGRRVEADDEELSVEAIEAELDMGRVAGVPLLDTGEVPAVPVAERRSVPAAPVLDSEPVAHEAVAEPEPQEDLGVEAGGDGDEPEGSVIDEEPTDEVEEAAKERILSLVRDLDAEPDDKPDFDDVPADVFEAEPEAPEVDVFETEPEAPEVAEAAPEEHDSETDEPVETPRVVDDLFARLRSEVPEVEIEVEGAADVGESPVEDHDAVEELGETDEPVESLAVEDAPVDDDPADDPDDPDEVMLERRDRAIGDLESKLARALKRALADDENDKLDLIRRRPTKGVATEVLPSTEVHCEAFVETATEPLVAALVAGRGFVPASEGHDAPDVSAEAVEDLALELADTLLSPIRERVSELTEGSTDDALDGVRACYRRWRGTLGELASQYVHAAFNRGVYQAVPDGSPVRWVVDPGAGPCPDGEDDALEGPIAKGSEFPTGHLHPPAHPGCRCLLVPGVL